MSTSSTQSRKINRRLDSLQSNGAGSREGSRPRKRPITHDEAYLFALRVAYLAYLLQPRARRTQHVPAPSAPIQRSSTSINDLMKDFSLLRDSKSTRFPHGFMSELEKRLTGVLMGKERKPEYNDAAIKRTFAAFFNAFTEQSFKKRMEKDRRVEDLVLIFFSNATKELQKGKTPGDDAWKLMVDRHLALFIRLISLVLKDHDWVRDRPELTTRLATLESKLLAHDQDLAASTSRNGGSGGSTIEVIVPLSYEIKDMPLVQVVARIFGVTNTLVQSDINKNKSVWTERAGLHDLKTYQMYLNLNSPRTLRKDDFHSGDTYEAWKKGETHDLSQMMLVIIQANPELAKDTSAASLPHINRQVNSPDFGDAGYPEALRRTSSGPDTSYVIDQPVDMSVYSSGDQSPVVTNDDDDLFTFIPPDTRAYFKFILAQALTFDLDDKSLQQSPNADNGPLVNILSKTSMDLLNEICLRWRVPQVSRATLFLDAIRDKFVDQEVSLDTLDAAFTFIKDPLPDNRKPSNFAISLIADRTKWTVADGKLYQRLLSALHDALLRDLFDIMQHCYEQKPPSVGPVLYVLEQHVDVDRDPSSNNPHNDLQSFKAQLHEALQQKAHEMYRSFLEKEVPQDQHTWEFYHVIQMGKAVVSLAQRIQKRYKKNPEILGVNPLTALVETILPLYAEDARDIVARILQLAQEKGEEVPIEDGFQLYGELVEIRRIHGQVLPGVVFAFHIEGLLADFVWRWIRTTESNITGWVEEAVKQDTFSVRTDNTSQIPTEDQRHSVSIIDIFSSFNQTIDRIVQLNWDEDLQYAKFMTALAKVVGSGIARYCELLEQRFSKEMDRLTPEQELAAKQTTQEKFLKAAKDAWSNKEKVEPFQFFPEVRFQSYLSYLR